MALKKHTDRTYDAELEELRSKLLTLGGKVEAEIAQSMRALTERDANSSLTTTWTVSRQGDGSRVTLRTEWQGAGGVGGFFERLFAPAALKRVYADTLSRLDRYATGKGGGRS